MSLSPGTGFAEVVTGSCVSLGRTASSANAPPAQRVRASAETVARFPAPPSPLQIRDLNQAERTQNLTGNDVRMNAANDYTNC